VASETSAFSLSLSCEKAAKIARSRIAAVFLLFELLKKAKLSLENESIGREILKQLCAIARQSYHKR
jgi:hypothetical protein